MTLEEKRDLVEILMCGSDRLASVYAGWEASGTSYSTLRKAVVARRDIELTLIDLEFSYEESCVEAAYRLIAEDPILRLEWWAQ